MTRWSVPVHGIGYINAPAGGKRKSKRRRRIDIVGAMNSV